MQSSGPLREGEIPPWWSRTTVRAERRRLLEWAVEETDSTREHERIRLGENQRVSLAAVVLADVFTRSNIRNLFEGIDSWPIKPPGYKESLKQEIRDWRADQHGGSWKAITYFARPGGRFLVSQVADERVPAAIEAVHLVLVSATPSLTLLIAAFYPFETTGDFTNLLQSDIGKEVGMLDITVRGRLGSLRKWNPLSRAKHVFYSMNVAYPTQLKKEACDRRLADLEANCWHWLNQMGTGRFGDLPYEAKPSLRFFLTENVEPFGSDSTALGAIGLDHSSALWNTAARDAFYFTELDHWAAKASRSAIIAANRDVLNAAHPDSEQTGTISTIGLCDDLIRHNTDLLRARGQWSRCS